MKKPWNKATLKKALKQEKKLLKAISSAHKSCQMIQANWFTNKYFNSWSAKYVAVARAYRELPNHRKESGMDLCEIASRIDPFQGTSEPVTLHYKPKQSDDDFRPIMDFGVENMALQYLTLRILEVRSDLYPFQYGTRKGVSAACQEVLSNLNAGFGYTAELDIRDCFPSVGVKVLSDHLPIPKKVTDRVISSQHLTLTLGNFKHCLVDPLDGEDIIDVSDPLYIQTIEEGRQGIPQGSATSSFVAEMIFAPMLSGLPECGRVIAYLDNFLIMGKTKDDVLSMIFSLEEALLSHPVGPFVSRVVSNTPPEKNFNFLGYEFYKKGAAYKARPSASNLSQFSYNFDGELDRIENGKLSIIVWKKKARDLKRYVRSWVASFSLWDKAPKFRANRLEQIEAAEWQIKQKKVV